MQTTLRMAVVALLLLGLGCVEPDYYVTGTGASAEPQREESPSMGKPDPAYASPDTVCSPPMENCP